MNRLHQFVAALDIRILHWINHHRIVRFDSVLITLSHATTIVTLTVLIGILSNALYEKSKSHRMKALILIVVFILSALTTFTFKKVMYRERPFYVYTFIEKLSDAGDSSFPSGHTLEVFALATAFAFLFPRSSLKYIFFAWAFFIAYTRMALGVHYPSDVFFGALIGGFIGGGIPLLLRNKIQ